jgi:fumarate hydratase class II
MGFRIERDSMGEVRVPDDVYWGAQTQRSLENFVIGDERMPVEVIHAYGRIKQAAAETNVTLGGLDADKAKWIIRAAAEVAAGTLDAHFPLLVWQTGSGTQTNMNCNEVIANRANELAEFDAGDVRHIHPNDDVNQSQSSNDTFPTAMHVAVVLALHEALHPALDGLLATLDAKTVAFDGIIKIGRTHLQDATPLRLGQEIGGWAAQVRIARRALASCEGLLHELAIGGTAVGTGLNAPEGFGDAVAARLARATGQPFASAENKYAALAGHEALTAVSGALSTLAAALMKLANDVRWLSSGPRSGIGELRIPANEPGSSIMPGKVNPTQAEALVMVCFQVFGNHTTVSQAAAAGNFELNVCKPVIVLNVLQSIRLLADATRSFDLRCLTGLEPNKTVIESMLERSLMLVTALSPHLGYDAAARIAKRAHDENLSLREAALACGVEGNDFDRWVRVEDMLAPRPGGGA